MAVPELGQKPSRFRDVEPLDRAEPSISNYRPLTFLLPCRTEEMTVKTLITTGFMTATTTSQNVRARTFINYQDSDQRVARDNYRSKPRNDRRDDYDDRDRDRRSPIRSNGRDRDTGRDRSDRPPPPPAKIRVDNLHYDLTEDDLFDLFGRIAPVREAKLTYDRAGRSDGTAFVTLDRIADAREAVRQFDGANAKGQPIRLTILPLPPKSARRDNPFDRAENPRSLFDRVEAPSGRGRRRSESPRQEDERDYSRNNSRREPRGVPRDRRTDIDRSAPDGIDRYVPGSNGRGGRRPVERRERPPRDGPRPGARPKKTAEELDAEMDDYWDGQENKEQVQPVQHSGTADDDVDMIE